MKRVAERAAPVFGLGYQNRLHLMGQGRQMSEISDNLLNKLFTPEQKDSLLDAVDGHLATLGLVITNEDISAEKREEANKEWHLLFEVWKMIEPSDEECM